MHQLNIARIPCPRLIERVFHTAQSTDKLYLQYINKSSSMLPIHSRNLQRHARGNYASLASSMPAGPRENAHSDSGKLGESYTCTEKQKHDDYSGSSSSNHCRVWGNKYSQTVPWQLTWQIRLSPRPFLSFSRVVDACAIMFPPAFN